jgi:hypothetical protein
MVQLIATDPLVSQAETLPLRKVLGILVVVKMLVRAPKVMERDDLARCWLAASNKQKRRRRIPFDRFSAEKGLDLR